MSKSIFRKPLISIGLFLAISVVTLFDGAVVSLISAVPDTVRSDSNEGFDDEMLQLPFDGPDSEPNLYTKESFVKATGLSLEEGGKLLNEMLSRFVDDNQDGRISRDEMLKWMKYINKKVTERTLTSKMKELDRNEDGKIGFDEIVEDSKNSAEEHGRQFTPDDELEIKQRFRAIDDNGDGYLDFEELLTLMDNSDASGVATIEAKVILEDSDTDGDGSISRDEFMQQRSLMAELTDSNPLMESTTEGDNVDRQVRVFRSLDTDDDGVLTVEELKAAIISQRLLDEEVEQFEQMANSSADYLMGLTLEASSGDSETVAAEGTDGDSVGEYVSVGDVAGDELIVRWAISPMTAMGEVLRDMAQYGADYLQRTSRVEPSSDRTAEMVDEVIEQQSNDEVIEQQSNDEAIEQQSNDEAIEQQSNDEAIEQQSNDDDIEQQSNDEAIEQQSNVDDIVDEHQSNEIISSEDEELDDGGVDPAQLAELIRQLTGGMVMDDEDASMDPAGSQSADDDDVMMPNFDEDSETMDGTRIITHRSDGGADGGEVDDEL